MPKILELTLAAVFGAIISLVIFSFTLGGWISSIKTRLDKLDSENTQTPGRVTKLESLGNAVAGLPAGVMIAWDPIVRDSTGQERSRLTVPQGWEICGTTKKSQQVENAVLVGVSTITEAGKIGGQAEISNGLHSHTGIADSRPGRSEGVHCSGKCGGPISGHDHTLSIDQSGDHSHGTNFPPYYSVVFLCKTNST
ncbi:hypothetical protein [Hyphococcus sp.]|uniref:hypothetical protein n=1 Tax=Hyphococcus sp. TaxID=2038636 RepID=UPI0035C713A4